MSEVEADIVVARPRQEVFDYLAWGENLPQWNSGMSAVQPITGGPPTQGSQYQVSMDPGGDSTLEYYDFVPGYRVCWHGSPIQMGPRSVSPKGRFELEDAEGGGTRILMVLEPELTGAAKAAAPMMKRKMRKDTEKDLATLKQLLEGG
jgi:uncharacterized protein YndB with AHSA1/START domain